MERVEGNRSDTVVYIDPNTGYTYYEDHFNESCNRYYRCTVSACPGRIVWRMDDQLEQRRNHNHEVNPTEVHILRFKEALRTRAQQESLSLRMIYTNESENHPLAVEFVRFTKATKRMMERARSYGTVPIPHTLVEMDAILTDPRFKIRLGQELGPAGKQFYGGLLGTDSQHILYFTSPTVHTILQNIEENVDLHMDVTFHAISSIINEARQLFVIHFCYERSVFPIMYCIMASKSYESYITLLRFFRDNVLKEIVVASIMTDYEDNLRKAVRIVFPSATLIGSWFHFSKDVCMKSRLWELTGHYNTIEGIQQGVQMAMVLPLLPQNLFEAGMTFIKNFMLEATEGAAVVIAAIENFFNHLWKQWDGENVSVHGLLVRNNISVESFHRFFMQLVGRQNPNVWMLVAYFQRIEYAKGCDLIRLQTGQQLPEHRNSKSKRENRENQQIQRAERDFYIDEDIAKFLKKMGYTFRELETNINEIIDEPARIHLVEHNYALKHT